MIMMMNMMMMMMLLLMPLYDPNAAPYYEAYPPVDRPRQVRVMADEGARPMTWFGIRRAVLPSTAGSMASSGCTPNDLVLPTEAVWGRQVGSMAAENAYRR
jgi:hypothetical protein